MEWRTAAIWSAVFFGLLGYMVMRAAAGKALFLNTRTPKIYLFHCANGYDYAEVMRGCSQHINEMKIIPLPCSGKLDILYLTKAFDAGADGAVIMVCKEGECRHMEGNLRAKKRAQAIDALLQETGLGPDRILVIQLDDGGIADALSKLEDFRLQIQTILQNDPAVEPAQTT
ncbi:MAG TPA: hydrogenase iron-sulfur subunit [Armatimonadota bacterium]